MLCKQHHTVIVGRTCWWWVPKSRNVIPLSKQQTSDWRVSTDTLVVVTHTRTKPQTHRNYCLYYFRSRARIECAQFCSESISIYYIFTDDFIAAHHSMNIDNLYQSTIPLWLVHLPPPPTTHIDTRRTKQMADSWWWLDILVRRSLIIHLWMREVSLHDEKQSFCAKQWPLIMWNSHTHTLTADEQQRQQLHPKSRDIIQLFDKQNYRLSEKFCALSVCKRKIL